MEYLNLKHKLKSNWGFSIVELSIAIIVLAVLVGIAVTIYSRYGYCG